MAKLGYDDTPFIPGSKYRVHDDRRPQPPVVEPPTWGSDASPGKPPSDAVVLLDGSSLGGWQGRDGDARWKLENGYMEVVPGTGDIQTRKGLGDGHYHLEWRAPHVVKGESQGRGNSGVFLMTQYEIQVLDCRDNPTYADGTTGAVYGQFPPLVNACRKPGEWQNYDILWTGPRFDGARLLSPPFVTVILNGIVVQHHREIQGPTRHRQTTAQSPHPSELPLKLQDHGDLVRYRNIWYRPFESGK